MTISALIPSLGNTAALKASIQDLADAKSASLIDMPDSTHAAIAAVAATELGGTTLVLTSRRDRAEGLASALAEYLPADAMLERWLEPDALPIEQLPFDIEGSVNRTRILAKLSLKSEKPRVLVATISGLMQLLMPRDELRTHSLDIRQGEILRIDSIIKWAQGVGYQTVPMVQEAGTIAHRGGIVDVFPPGFDEPVRIDFFGDEVETIRHFSPHSQRSTSRLKRLRLLPPMELPVWRLRSIANELSEIDTNGLRAEVRDEWLRQLDHIREGIVPTAIDLFAGYLVPECTTLVDYLPRTTTVIVDNPGNIRLAAEQVQRQAEELFTKFAESGELAGDLKRSWRGADDVISRIQQFVRLSLGSEELDPIEPRSLDTLSDPPLFAGRLNDLVDDLRGKLQRGWRVAIATDQVNRLTEILQEKNVEPRPHIPGNAEPLPAGMVELVPSDLVGGWNWSRGKVAIWTDFEIFGFRKQPRRMVKQRTSSESRAFAASLEPGEYVVHVDHGVGLFNGLVRMEVGGIEREYLLLEFQKGDKLYVPVDQSDRVTKYSSGGNLAPSLNKLGSGEWTNTKRRVKRAVREMAFELIQLYAYRDSGKGFQFPENSKWDEELAESFPFIETRDQAAAIRAVTTDMESYRPMDRLICGDVGFGKTEVAVRAAFKAANAGKQVAILVPTTILALQHYQTFRQRMAAFPINVQMMSRLRTKKQQAKTIEQLRNGQVDIVIGTHRLVQKDVNFKDLGLVIVDEEQRFGVRQKEFLKTLRTEVDVLSMSATPIPRTLHLSMSGIRDISMIETAPQARLPIRTFVTPWTDQLVREVILREMERGGQIYVVHNRVHDIDRLSNHLRELVPEARFGVGHGQMDESVLEEVMLQFMRHEFDVLISTTIIESGVDIANVNTMIIDNADTLGLTQLYQLRGRVGRSTNRAYAYLLYQPHKSLSIEAQERLETIQEATELGAGLRVAMRDLEIRGAGNILGAEQSGHIGAVGYELYMRLLSQAVEEIRSGQPALEPGPITLDLPMTALIPDDYIHDTELRLNTYRQIAAVETLDQVDELADELSDRFGAYPEEVEHLLALIRLRIRAADLGIDSVVERERMIVVRPVVTSRLDQRALERAAGPALRLTPNSIRLRLLDLDVPWQQAVNGILTEVERSKHAALAEIAG